MTRGVRTAVLSLAAALVAAAASGCAVPGGTGIAVAGDTRIDLVTVTAPRLGTPVVDVTLGIATLQTQAAQTARRKRAAATAASAGRGPVVAGTLTRVAVRAGDAVKTGQVLAVLDDRLLRLGVQNAEATYRRAVATADSFGSQASDLRDQRDTVIDARTQLRTAAGTLAEQKALLEAGVAKAKQAAVALPGMLAGRARLAAALHKAQLAARWPHPPADNAQTIAALKKQLAILDAQIAGVRAAVAALPKMLAGLALMRAGQAQLATAKAQIATALDKIDEGVETLQNVRDTLHIAADAQRVGVDVARTSLDQATLRSPCDGVVVSAVPSGQVAMVGSPVVAIRPAGPTLVDAYLAPEQAGAVRAGDRADVVLDSVSERLTGTVAMVWPEQTFPPTNYPTQIVHLSRVVRVTVELPDGELPLGIPADVIVHPAR